MCVNVNDPSLEITQKNIIDKTLTIVPPFPFIKIIVLCFLSSSPNGARYVGYFRLKKSVIEEM